MRTPTGREYRLASLTAWAWVLGLLLAGGAGCSRALYRHGADREVYGLIASGAEETGGPPARFTIEPQRESRMYDPGCPDFPPMPPDDPTSHRLMHCVDGKPGWPGWECYGHTPHVENPDWMAYLPRDDEGKIVLDRQAAVQLALVHSREYQASLEDLYLSALDVTFQRFRFDAQFFGGNSTFFDAEGRLAGGRSLLSTDTDLQMRRLMASGGELVVGMANSLVWQFAGPDTYSANTLLDFSLVQPLLRAGGRPVVLEQLTDAERALLANIRQLERFRRGFYAQMVTGRSPGPGPARGGVGFAGVSSGGARSAGNFLGLLQQQVEIRNQRSNVTGLHDSLQRMEALNEVGRISSYDVNFTRTNLYDAQSSLLSINANYETALDAYKITLGLAPQLHVKIEDPLLARFSLIDPALTDTQEEMADLLDRVRQWEEQPEISQPDDYQEVLTSLRQEIAGQLEAVRHDFQLLLEAVPAREQRLQQLAARPEFQQGEVDVGIVDVAALRQRVVELCRELEGNEAAEQLADELQAGGPTGNALDGAEARQLDQQRKIAVGGEDQREPTRGLAWELSRTLLEIEQCQQVAATPDVDVAAWHGRLVEVLTRLSGEILQLSLVQARARLDTVTLVPIEIDPQEALEVARKHRRDWMNARAALVDVWRQIELAANDLESGLDVVFSGELNTTDNNPVQFRSSTGRLRVGLEFDAPLTRLAERNAYRETLIAYQQARRRYYAIEDRIAQSLRETLRRIRLNQLDFEVQRASVFVAISQVDRARLKLEEPARGMGAAEQLGANAARNLVDALQALLRAQNDFLRVWVDQEVQRLSLDLDLGTMELDSQGLWIDPGPMKGSDIEDGGARDESPLVREEAGSPPPPLGQLEQIPAPPAEPLADGP